MAFVKLPSRLRSIEIRRPDRRAARVDFSVFAGEIVRDQRSKRGGAARWTVRSSRQEQVFDFLELPIETRRGHVVAVVAAMPSEAESGPIVAVADVEADRRVDFLHREPELLRLLSGYGRDYRDWRPSFGLLAAMLAQALVIGALVFVAALAADGALPAPLASLAPALAAGDVAAWTSFAAALEAGLVAVGGPALVGAAAGALAGLHRGLFAWARARRRARYQSALLDAVWKAAGEALGFVQDNAAAFHAEDAEAARAAEVERERDRERDRLGARRRAGPPRRVAAYAPPPVFLGGHSGQVGQYN